MKVLSLLIAVASLISCTKSSIELPPSIDGKWELVRTELFVEGILSGSAQAEELAVIYEFESATEREGKLSISEEGSVQNLNYSYDPIQKLIVTDSQLVFQIEHLDKTKLLLSVDQNGSQLRYYLELLQ